MLSWDIMYSELQKGILAEFVDAGRNIAADIAFDYMSQLSAQFVERERIRHAEYNALHKEEIKATSDAYRAKNRPTIRKAQAAYRDQNRDKIRQKAAARRNARRDEIRAYQRAYRAKRKLSA